MTIEPGQEWCAAIQERAERDGLRVIHRWGSSGATYDDWRARNRSVNLWGVAALLKPDGSQYQRRLASRKKIEQAMLSDWGETLVSARERAEKTARA